MSLPPDVTVKVTRNIAGPWAEGDTVTVVRTTLVSAWIEAGVLEEVPPVPEPEPAFRAIAAPPETPTARVLEAPPVASSRRTRK